MDLSNWGALWALPLLLLICCSGVIHVTKRLRTENSRHAITEEVLRKEKNFTPETQTEIGHWVLVDLPLKRKVLLLRAGIPAGAALTPQTLRLDTDALVVMATLTAN